MLVCDPHVARPRDHGARAGRDRASSGSRPRCMRRHAWSRTRNRSLDAIAVARDGGFDGFVGVGGGSSLDTAKIAALFATHGGELLRLRQQADREGTPACPGRCCPVVAVPTTAGTGSEATSVAIVDFPRLGVKTGISHRYLRPRIGDRRPAAHARALPAAVTASCGLDVVCHAAESYHRTPLRLAREVGPRRAPALPGLEPDRRPLERPGARVRRPLPAPGRRRRFRRRGAKRDDARRDDRPASASAARASTSRTPAPTPSRR